MKMRSVKKIISVIGVLAIITASAACSAAKPPEKQSTLEAASLSSEATQPQQQNTTSAQKRSVSSGKPLEGKTIGIDAGHQKKADLGMEPVAPGSPVKKHKVSGGTRGVATKIPEYKLNLKVALRLQKELEALGAKVVMTRVKNAVDISNSERAKLMNKNKVDAFVRIHANGNKSHDVHGMSILVPSKKGYLKGPLQAESERLGDTLLKETIKTTEAKNLGLSYRNDQTGINWSKVPVCIIEMGYMTNPSEDKLLNKTSYQKKIVNGLVNGLIKFLE
jgi:N-acetylmuramoyl-L-alanine amidase